MNSRNYVYYVYILTNHYNTVLYIGVTNDIVRRTYEHKKKLGSNFTKKYNVNKLVYYEAFEFIALAIAREKKLKGWSRAKKDALIERKNNGWKELYCDGRIEKI